MIGLRLPIRGHGIWWGNWEVKWGHRAAVGFDLCEWSLPLSITVGRVTGNVRVTVLCFYAAVRCAIFWRCP